MRGKRARIWLMAVGTVISATPAWSEELPKQFSIGRNVNGEACIAQANLNDPGLYDRSFDRSYAITCGSATASRAVGMVRVISKSAAAQGAVEKTLECAAAQPVSIKGLGQGDARMCNDSTLGIRTVTLRFSKGNRLYVGNSALSLAGPLEHALGIASGVVALTDDSASVIQPTIDVKSLPQLSDSGSFVNDDTAFNPRNALQQGIRFNVQGLFAVSWSLKRD
jgi:hypothetical protein